MRVVGVVVVGVVVVVVEVGSSSWMCALISLIMMTVMQYCISKVVLRIE